MKPCTARRHKPVTQFWVFPDELLGGDEDSPSNASHVGSIFMFLGFCVVFDRWKMVNRFGVLKIGCNYCEIELESMLEIVRVDYRTPVIVFVIEMKEIEQRNVKKGVREVVSRFTGAVKSFGFLESQEPSNDTHFAARHCISVVGLASLWRKLTNRGELERESPSGKGRLARRHLQTVGTRGVGHLVICVPRQVAWKSDVPDASWFAPGDDAVVYGRCAYRGVPGLQGFFDTLKVGLLVFLELWLRTYPMS
ncbi:hypothetical protein DEO72_LG2g3637 [Vigna unguiculata]|uniref:Uncharacterized protein n=1 Tax=Vigna unguiculata TaxID=3917 RepID=A0A4D6L454_VIGUN|nr:hypothetical protein DEO72_LG2g3637 [Vigna unguiculata]